MSFKYLTSLSLMLCVCISLFFTSCSSSNQLSCPGFDQKPAKQLAVKQKTKDKKTKKVKKSKAKTYETGLAQANTVPSTDHMMPTSIAQAQLENDPTPALGNDVTASTKSSLEGLTVLSTVDQLAVSPKVETAHLNTINEPAQAIAIAAPLSGKQKERLNKKLDKLDKKLQKRHQKSKRGDDGDGDGDGDGDDEAGHEFNNKRDRRSNMALAGGILGIGAIIGIAVPFVGFGMAIAAIVLGAKGLKSKLRGWALTGIILGSLTLLGALFIGLAFLLAFAILL